MGMRLVTFCLFLQICICNVYCKDESSFNQLLTNYVRFNCNHPQEKVYLHMDNRSYYIGDTIWFKAYVMNATTLHPTHTSGVLYVELLNEHGVEMEHKKLRIVDGMCHGEFALKDTYRTGYYEIRAYTRNMLNFGDEERMNILAGSLVMEPVRFMNYNEMAAKIQHPVISEKDSLRMRSSIMLPRNYIIFSRVFPVYVSPAIKGDYKREMEWYPPHGKLSLPLETEPTLRPENLHVSFFPEGGSLVLGINSVVAFEAVDQWGRKCHIKGRISDGEKTVTTFSTTTNGRGIFDFCPQRGVEYTAVVNYHGQEYKFSLPKPEDTGYTLQLNPFIDNENASVSVKSGTTENHDLLGLALQCRGSLLAFDTLRLQSNDSIKFELKRKMLVPGVNQLTLFDAKGRVFADRLFFVHPTQSPATLSIEHLPDSLSPFQKITFDMDVQDNTYRGFSRGFFSLSVTDAADSLSTYDTRDIRSELLLSSDLKGFIENVDTYFSQENDSIMARNLDILMLVQGWRRYEWRTMAGVQPFHHRYAVEKGLTIDGYVISDQLEKGKSIYWSADYPRIPSLKMRVSLSGEYISFRRDIEVDSLGNFSLPLNYLAYDYSKMKIKLYPTKESQQFIKQNKLSMRHSYTILNRVFSPMVTPYSFYQSHTPNDFLINNADTSHWMMNRNIDEIVIQKRRSKRADIYYDRPEISINYNKEWNNLIDRGIPGIFTEAESFLRDKMSIDYSLRRAHLFSAYVKPDSVNRRMAGAYVLPKVIKVYSNVISRDSILQLDPRTEELFHSLCSVDYYSRDESPLYPPYQSRNNVRHTYFEGYSRVAQFYSPDYSDCALPDSVDYRRTLYWNPDVETDFYGNASVTFYNNKQTKHLHVRAEGITEHGEFIVFDSDKKQ